MVNKGARGYTLVEMMMTAAIMGVVLSLGPALLLQVNRFFSLTSARAALQREARPVLYVLTRELHQAKSNTIVIDRVNAGQPFCSRITFTKIQGSSMSFYQSGNQIIQAVGNDNTILSKNLSYLAFAFPRSNDMTLLSIGLTLQKDIYQGKNKTLHVASQKIQIMN